MKKFISIAILILISLQMYSQSPKVDTLRLVRGGKLFRMIIYSGSGHRDSVDINGYMFYDGFKYDKNNPNVLKGSYPNSLIRYEGIRGINGTGKPKKSLLVIFHPGDDILYALDSIHGGGGEPAGPVRLDILPVEMIYNMDTTTWDSIPVNMRTGIKCAQDITLRADKMLCIGDTAHDGSWRIGVSGQALILLRRESGSWVVKQGFNQP